MINHNAIQENAISSSAKDKGRGLKGERYDAVLDDPGPPGDCLAGVVNDGARVVPDCAREVVLAADLYGLVDGRSQPRHRGGVGR